MTTGLDKIFEKYPNRLREDLIPMLQMIQDRHGYLSEEMIREVGIYLRISVNKIYGVATFYDNFRFGPRGRVHIRICHGTACHVAGAATLIQELEKQLQIKDGETDKEGLFSLEVVSCIGACGLAPLVEINQEYFTCLTDSKLKDLIKQFREKDQMIYES
jgi:NADH-quinone oxidoreductase subunit E